MNVDPERWLRGLVHGEPPPPPAPPPSSSTKPPKAPQGVRGLGVAPPPPTLDEQFRILLEDAELRGPGGWRRVVG